MAFRFKLDEPIEKDFRRIGLEQIQRARTQLAANADAATEVHEARKCIKRIRALLRLGREGLGDRTFRAENARFRSIAALMAPARDQYVVLQTILKLETETPEHAAPALARLRAAVLDPSLAADTNASRESMNEASAALERAAKRFRNLRIAPDDFATLVKGLTRSYKRGLKWLEIAYADGRDEAFHELRKCVQAHWRHMALLSRAWPALFEARIAAARELSQILGDDHDLAILKLKVASLSGNALADDDAREAEALIAERQQALRLAAKPRTQLIFAASAKAHGRWITSVWDAATAKSRQDAALAAKGEAAELLPAASSARA